MRAPKKRFRRRAMGIAVTAGVLWTVGLPLAAGAGMVPAITQSGKTVQVEILQFGKVSVVAAGVTSTVGKDSEGGEVRRGEGAKLSYQRTDTVPLEVGQGFGFRLKMPAIPAGDALTVDVVVTLPSISIDMTVERSTVRGRLVYDHSHSGEYRNVSWRFSEENARYHKTGDWTMSLYNNGRLMVSQPFTVVSPFKP